MTDTPYRPPLSPAAQAVLDAFLKAPMGQSHVDDDLIAIAAAMRAAAERISFEADPGHGEWGSGFYEGVQKTCLELFAIAAELEGVS